ncbi:DUF2971 domain-containing protein [Hymenobacter seoulensis]
MNPVLGEEYIPKGRVYKYTSFSGAKATLEKSTFRFTYPLEFNDPFDCNLMILDYEKTAEAVQDFTKASKQAGLSRASRRRFLRSLDKRGTFKHIWRNVVLEKIYQSKVTCFSKTYKNTLMWSHYADQHKDICLEFNADIPKSTILHGKPMMMFNVNYDRTERINYNLNKTAAIIGLFTRKSSDWHYEEEVRIIMLDPEAFHVFDNQFLTGIIFGCRTPKSEKEEILQLLKKHGYQIEVRQAERGEFELKFRTVSK